MHIFLLENSSRANSHVLNRADMIAVLRLEYHSDKTRGFKTELTGGLLGSLVHVPVIIHTTDRSYYDNINLLLVMLK